MDRTTLQVGSFGVNCSILSENGEAWVVDPGQEGARIVRHLKDRQLKLSAILLTHAHFDHIGAIADLQGAFPGVPVYVHPSDCEVMCHPMNQLAPEYPPIARPGNVRDARTLSALGGSALSVIETPGHTPGGVCYRLQDTLFSGDTLFAGSIGRTDLPGGDMATLMNSLRNLVTLPDATLVIPGHGMFTTIADEKRGNPFLQ